MKLVKFFIGWPLSLIAFFFIFKVIAVNSSTVISTIISANKIDITLSIICYLLYYYFRSYFWKKLLEENGHPLPFKETAYLWGLSELRRFIPGNIWGVLGRTVKFSEKGVTNRIIFASLIIESVMLVIATIMLSTLSNNFIIFGLLPHFPLQHELAFITPTLIFIATALYIFWQSVFKTKRFFSFIFPHFKPKENILLLGIMLISMVFLSLGTYFSVSAITSLYLPDFLTFIGFFSFSFFAGYMSFITPMGLGVREGVITFGLSKFIPLEMAGIGSILARIVLIFSELIFIGVSYFLFKTKNRMVGKLERFFISHRYEIFLSIGIAIYIIYFTAASFLRYSNFFTGRFDLGNMDQTLWHTVHGNFFQLTNPDGTNNISRLSIHADFILACLAPFYCLWQDPRMLLLLQTVILSLGAVFVYFLAKFVIKNKLVSLIFAFCFLLNPMVEHTNLYDFHAIALATTFLLGAFYFLVTKRYVWFLVFSFLAGVTKEEVWVIVGFMGLYGAFFQKKKLFGISTFIFCIAFFYILIKYAIPMSRGSAHFALSYYSDFGNSPDSILRTIIFSPQKIIGSIFQYPKLLYIFELFLPLGFLAFFAPLTLIFAVPDFAINLLSNNSQLYQIHLHYTAAITPFIFISSIYGFRKITRLFPSYAMYFAIIFLITTLISSYNYGPLPGRIHPNVDMFNSPQLNKDIIDNFLQDIPRRFSVAATNNIGSHLSHRRNIYTVPVGIDQADIIVFLLNDPFAQPSPLIQKSMVENMKRDKNYIEVFKLNDFIVFEKRNLYRHIAPSPTKTRLFPVSISALQNRDYVGGEIEKGKILNTKPFINYLFSYSSDGLRLYGVETLPRMKMPKSGFPVIILNTGYVDPSIYNIESNYSSIANYFASKGFVVIKPELRGRGKSDTDSSISETFSYPIDLLNLLSSLSNIKEVDTEHIFLWGHSVGSETALVTLETYGRDTNPTYHIKAAALWNPVIDPYSAYMRFSSIFPGKNIPYLGAQNYLGSFQKNPLLWERVSPIFYISDITTPIQISQGTNDPIIPYAWSIELYDDLLSYNKTATLQMYSDDHSLSHFGSKALQSNVAFFRKYLSK